MINQTISHYHVTGQVGAGGMGVVYEAEDLTLGRKVALKFLPAHLSRDQSALERFLFEARTASALNHPNICTIYAVESATGPEGEAQSFIAMELLEGQNLAEKLYSGALPVDRLVEIAIQLADALEAAHAKGVIHRDIKPANIFLTQRGQVKVLDFGLAKLSQREMEMETIGATQESPSPMQLTSPGSTVGTIAYMSPEQARGEPLDTRTDLFSVGTVLYQMSTGKMPFSGATSAVIFHAILELDPAPVQQLNAALPPKLEEIIEKLLEKDRDLRYQSAADLRGDLKRLKRDLESGRKMASRASSGAIAVSDVSVQAAMPASGTSQVTAEVSAARKKIPWGLMGTAAALVLAGLLAYSIFFRTRTVAFQNFTVTKVTDSGNAAQVAISPDGKYILTLIREGGLASLQLRNLPTNSVTQVQPPADVDYNGLRFAPDGNYFYFVRSDPGNDELQFLYRAPLLGGSPEKLAEDVDSNATFSPDGGRVAFIRNDNPKAGEYQLIVKDLQSGAEKALVTGPDKQRLEYPAWSPDGKVIVCYISQPEGALTGLDIVDVKSGERKPLVRSQDVISRPEWLPDGKGLLALSRDATTHFTRAQVIRVSYPEGAMEPVTRDASNYPAISLARNVPILALVASDPRWDFEVMTGSGGEAKPVAKSSGGTFVAWTLDGKLITDNDNRLRAVDVENGTQSIFGVDVGLPEFEPSTCRDGRVVFVSYVPETKQIGIWSLDAAGQSRKRLTSGMLDYSPECSPDGRWLYYLDRTTALLMRVPIDGGTPEKISDLQLEDEFDVSKDGTRALIAFVSHTEGHKEKVVEVEVEGGQVKREIEMQKQHVGRIQYSPDGEGLEYVFRENGVDNIWWQPLDGRPGKAETAFKSEHIGEFRWSADRKRLAMVRGHTDSDVVLMRSQQQ